MIKFYALRRILVILLVLVGVNGLAQTTRVTGKVTSDDDGGPLPGVSILEKGTTNGTVTDSDGNFAISASNADATLVFSFVGYASQEISITAKQSINVVLKTDVTALNEVVVLGYGVQEKKDVTGSILSFSTKDFNKGVVTSPQELLIGKVAGVQITTNSGAPGSGASIRVRGGSSLKASNDPLIVIDGFPVDNDGVGGFSNPLSTINPNDIESINVLKDASATAIYGSRASNGVIIIVTKKGKQDKFQLAYNGNYSLSNPIKYVDVLDADEYSALVKQLRAQEYSGFNDATVALLGNAKTNWQKEIFRTAFTHDHNLSASGSVKGMPYRVSYGYTDQDGILKNTDLQRNSLNINLNPSFLDGALNVNASFKGAYTNQNYGNDGAVGAAVAFDPTQPVRSDDPKFAPYGGYFAWLSPDGKPISIATANPVALIEQTDNHAVSKRAIGTLQIDYAIPFVPGLKANLSTGFDMVSAEGHNYAPKNAAWSSGGPGNKNDYTTDNKSKLLDFFLNYRKEIDKHTFDVTGGYSYQAFTRDGTSFVRNFDETVYSTYQVSGEDTIAYQNTPNPNVLISVFGRLNYSFNSKYLLTATIRNDASSRFSPENRSGWFPSVAAGWNIHEEGFLQGSKAVSMFKLRVGYGITGQQDVGGTYPYLALYTKSTETAKYQLGTNYLTTYRPNGFDANIKWEETTTINAGIDFGFINDRITGTFDIYSRQTNDLLNYIPVPAGSNLTNYLTTNVGDLENKGVEASLNYKVIQKSDFNWNVGVNFARNQNKITALTRVNDPNYPGILVGGISGGVGNTIQNHQVGYPAYSFFVFQQIYDQNGRPIEGLYVDRTGKGGSIISNDANRYRYRTPYPQFLAGINTSLTYKAIDFGFSGRLSIGNYVYNNNLSDRARYSTIYNPSGYINNVPSEINEIQFNNAQYLSDYFVENASFFKMDYISAGYSFKNLFNNKLAGRVGFTVNNAFIITDYSGIDPEVNRGKDAGGADNVGIDNNIYPRPRVYMLNLSLKF
jgi:TonB-dependent starch-binding outer membrane protein SusC